MTQFARLRICERCWRPIAPKTICKVRKHVLASSPLLEELTSFQHLATDPDCTGDQRHG